MSTKLISVALAMLGTCLLVAAPPGQEFVDEAGKYKITLTEGWRASTYTDATGRTKTEFIFRQRSDALLRVSKEGLDRRSLADVARKELEGLRLCQPGLTVGGDEPFEEGVLSGRRLAFCYVEAGSWFAAVYYFLEDCDSVWILRFTGRMGRLDTTHDLTDQIARSFRPI